MMVDHSTQHEQHPLIHLQIALQIYKMYEMDINATFWHIVKGIFYMHQVPIVFHCCTNPIFSVRSQQTHKIYEKYCHNYSNLARNQMLCYMH